MPIIPDVRPVTEDERRLFEWLLYHGTTAGGSYLKQFPSVSVVSRCGCGCPTIDLAVSDRGASLSSATTILADAYGMSPEGVRVGIIVHGREGLISELEVYSLSRETKFSPPRLEDIENYDGA